MPDDRMARARHEFLVKHQDADVLEFNTVTKCPTRAVYYSLDEKFEQDRKRSLMAFFTAVRELADEFED